MGDLVKRQWKRLLGFLGGAGEEEDTAPREDGAETASTPAGPDSLSKAIKRIRDSARWIVVSFGAIAAIIIGTAPLDKVGNVDAWSSRFWIAVAAFAVIVGAVGLVMWAAAAVDAPAMITAEQLKLVEEGTELSGVLNDDSEGIKKAAEWIRLAGLTDLASAPGSKPIESLLANRDRALRRWIAAQDQIDAAHDAASRGALQAKHVGTKARFTRLDERLDDVLRLANYYRLNRRFDRRKPLMITAGALAAMAIVSFMYAIDIEKPKATPPDLAGVVLQDAAGVDFHGASLAGAKLAGTNLRGADLSDSELIAADLAGADLTDADLSKADLSAADLGGATGLDKDSVKGATWTGATCPDDSAVTERHGTCEDHLSP